MNIILHGCNGRMGRMLTSIIEKEEDMVVVAGVDTYNGIENTYPVYNNISEVDIQADVIIDFSTASAIKTLIAFCKKTKTPLVLCSTGLTETEEDEVTELSKEVPVLRSSNMSLGINILVKLLKNVTRTLYDNGFDIEIIEKHHNQKIDAPSGTALSLAEAISEELPSYEYRFDRSKEREKRKRDEIGILSLRGGSIVGEHEVVFAGLDEVIEIKHSAYSRSIFAKGAISAARFLVGKAGGKYTMEDVISEKI